MREGPERDMIEQVSFLIYLQKSSSWELMPLVWESEEWLQKNAKPANGETGQGEGEEAS